MDGLLAARPRELGSYAASQTLFGTGIGEPPRGTRSTSEESAIIEFNFEDIYKTFAVSSKEVFEQVERALTRGGTVAHDIDIEIAKSPREFADRVVETIALSLPTEENPEARTDAIQKAKQALTKGFENAEAKLQSLGGLTSDNTRTTFEQTKTETTEKLARLEQSDT